MSKKKIVLGTMITVAVLVLAWFGTKSVLAGMIGDNGPFGGLAGFHCQVERLIEQLQLTEDQQQRIDAVHAIVEQHVSECAGQHGQHLQELITGIEQGNLDVEEVNAEIAAHLAKAQQLATAVSNELVPLVNSLDPDQRTLLLEHLRSAQEQAAGCPGHCHGLLGRLHGHGHSG